MTDAGRPKLWIEIDDLVRYFESTATPTGTGRVQLEVIPRLLAAYPGQVGLCRIGESADDVRAISPVMLAKLSNSAEFSRVWKGGNPVQVMLGQARLSLSRKVHDLIDGQFLAKAERHAFRLAIAPGSTIVSLGASWTHRNFGHSLRTLKARHGLKFALLVHDILPVTHPQFVSAGFRPSFLGWLEDMRQTWDMVMTPSRDVAAALAAHLTAIDAPVPPITPIPFGFGFKTAEARKSAAKPIGNEPYALFVSTIEIRKNHILLFRIWERLLKKYGPTQVPQLVFAGKMGWDVDELRNLLSATGNLAGKIQIVSHLSDEQMARAYEDSICTLFPSFCEGWGLPVSESLCHGKLCIASSATSIPEIGGDAVDYFDPGDEQAAFAAIDRALFQPGYVARRERWIRDNFRLPLWEDTAHAIVAAITAPQSISSAKAFNQGEMPVTRATNLPASADEPAGSSK